VSQLDSAFGRIIPYLEDKYPDRKKLGKPDEVDKV
jgi:hypothetical protein